MRGRAHNVAVAPPPAVTARDLARAPLFSSSEVDNSLSSSSDTAFGGPRGAWLASLEALELHTSTWRARRAARHRWKSGTAVKTSTAEWHRQRERGQAERFERIAACGAVQWVQERHSPEGTTSRPVETSCGCWRACERCLEKRRFRLRRDIEAQRDLAMKVVHKHRLAKWYGRGAEGRWSEKMFTLTVPHGESVEADARLLTTVWASFSELLATHLRQDRGMPKGVSPVWVRTLEVTPGEGESGGHAHLHVWFFGPFVDVVWMHVQWGRLLEKLGREVPRKPWAEAMAGAVDKRAAQWCRTRRGVHGRETDDVPWSIVYLEAERGDAALSKYTTKVGARLYRYVVKGGKREMQRVTPFRAAAVYRGLESARAVQWSRGWAPKRLPVAGVTYSRRRLTPEEEAAVHAPHALADKALVTALDLAACRAVESTSAPPVTPVSAHGNTETPVQTSCAFT